MIDWNNIGVYGNCEPSPTPKIGDMEIRDGWQWCYLSKTEGTCTISQWYRISSDWNGRYHAIDEKTGYYDPSVKIPDSLQPPPAAVDLSGMVFKAGDLAGGRKLIVAKQRSIHDGPQAMDRSQRIPSKNPQILDIDEELSKIDAVVRELMKPA